jgi:hypothetical protein
MANYCWNYVSLRGDSKVLKLIKSKFEKYDQCDYFQEFGNYVLGLGEIGDETWKETQDYYDYGTKWWVFEIEDAVFSDDDTPDDMIINGDSAWSPPVALIEQMCKKYGISAEMEYEESGMNFAGIVKMDSTGIISQEDMTYYEYQYRDDVENWMDNLSANYEDCEDEDLENIYKDHSYASKTHLDELINTIKNEKLL